MKFSFTPELDRQRSPRSCAPNTGDSLQNALKPLSSSASKASEKSPSTPRFVFGSSPPQPLTSSGRFNFGASMSPENTQFTFRNRHDSASESQMEIPSLPSPVDSPQSQVTPNETTNGTLQVPERPLSSASTASEVSHVQEYDVRSEQPPTDTGFFDPRFQAQLMEGKNVAKQLADALQSCKAEQDDYVRKLQSDATKFSQFHPVDTRKVALVGVSGAGKSSLINSLLHCPQLADAADVGKACTSVVIEYRQRKPEHRAPFTIEVDHLSNQEIEQEVAELLWNYRRPYIPDVEQNSSTEEFKKIEEKSNLASETFKAAFGHHSEFNEKQLQDLTPGTKEEILQKLTKWSQEIEWPKDEENGDNEKSFVANTAEECCEKTKLFMKDNLWPFTKGIRVYLNAQILEAGVVLVDLPGLRDTNIAKVCITEKYLLGADHIFVVAPIHRALSDQSLKSSVYQALAQHVPQEWEESAAKSLNVSVVCTRTDDIDMDNSSSRAQFCGPGRAISTRQFEELDRRLRVAKQNGNRKLKKQLKTEKQWLMVDARNQFVEKGLMTAYAGKAQGAKLRVFCVSSFAYQKYTRKGNLELVDASGIPRLRQFCHSITAEPQLAESKNFLQSQLPSLLNSTRLWMDKAAAQTACDSNALAANEEARESLLATIRRLKTSIDKVIDQSVDQLKNDVVTNIVEFSEKRTDHWETAAERGSDAWNRWHHTQYNAWCNNDGHHYTRLRGDVDWNQHIVWKMRSELEFQWEMTEDSIPETYDKIKCAIERKIQRSRSKLLELGIAGRILELISQRFQNAQYQLQLAQRETQKTLKSIRLNASETNRNSYVTSGMLSAYRSAAEEFGTGRFARQKRTVQGRIGDGNLFPPIIVQLRGDLMDMKRGTQAEAKRIIRETIVGLKSDVRMYYDQEVDHARTSKKMSDSEIASFDELQKYLSSLEEKLTGIQAAVAEVSGEKSTHGD